MSTWKSRLTIAALLALAAAMLADLSTAPRSTFTAANYERLKIDMTKDEVIAILGEPDSVNNSLRDVDWVIWQSPFDTTSSIAGYFVMPSGHLKSIERTGHLPNRPLLIPDELPERRTPPFVLELIKRNQAYERRTTLMLDPPAPVSNEPYIP